MPKCNGPRSFRPAPGALITRWPATGPGAREELLSFSISADIWQGTLAADLRLSGRTAAIFRPRAGDWPGSERIVGALPPHVLHVVPAISAPLAAVPTRRPAC